MRHDTHTHHIMQDTDSFYVRICGCGVIHLCFGATTLNLTHQAVIAVSETLKEITSELHFKTQMDSITQDPQINSESANVIQGHFS
jgi:hypothetical protein